MSEPSWPKTGQRITLRVPSQAEEVATIVNAVVPSQRTVARDNNPLLLLGEPFTEDGGVVEPLETGSPMWLFWVGEHGQHDAPATMIQVVQDAVRLWEVRVAGTLGMAQRRRYTRANDALPVHLLAGSTRMSAVLSDLGEGGAKCVVVDKEPDMKSGDVIEVQMEIGGEAVKVAARLLTVTRMDTDRHQLRFQFGPMTARAEKLVRRRVFDQQRRAKAMGT